MRRYAAFALAGGIGLAVDAAVLALLTSGLGLDPLASRIVSIATAMVATWLVNRTFTFGPSGRAIHAEAARYGGVAIGSALLNYAVFALLMLAVPRLWPLAALGLASATAMVASWLGYSRLVFQPR